MHAAGPGKQRIKSFGTWKSSGFERKGGKRNSFSSPPSAPHSGLLSLLPRQGRPLGLGSCPPKAARLGRGAGPGAQHGPAGARWGPAAPAGRAGHCIGTWITVSPRRDSVHGSSEGTPLSQQPPPSPPQLPRLGRRELGIRLGSGRTGVIFEPGERGGGTAGQGEGSHLEFGHRQLQLLVFGPDPDHPGIFDNVHRAVAGHLQGDRGSGEGGEGWSHSPGAGTDPPPQALVKL